MLRRTTVGMGPVRRGIVALLVLAGLVLVAPSAPATPAADPTRSGRMKHSRIEYDAGPAVLMRDPVYGVPQPVDLHGEIHLPAGRGPFPVLLFMHGRHGTCKYVTVEFLGHPCPDAKPVMTPVDSFAGYGYLAQNLASHGYLVVSVDANGINTFDTGAADSGAVARAELISRTLDLLAEWNVGPGPGDVGDRLSGKVDLRRLGLMGHSRGGEGVTRWVAYNETRADGPRYRLSALFSLAPTDFLDHTISDGTPYAVLLPRCDGDVADLQGADVFERSQYDTPGPLHQITVEGANHNWFNTVWTSDDFGETGDETCGSESEQTGRLSPEAQERVGLTWMAAFFRRYVGGERGFDALLTGRGARAVQCSDDLPFRCEHVTDVSYDPGPRSRVSLVEPELSDSAATRDQAGGRLTPGPGLDVAGCDVWRGVDCPKQGSGGAASRSKGPQLTLDWARPTGLTLTAGAKPWRGDPRGDFVVRLGVNAEPEPHRIGIRPLRLRVRLTDRAGRAATVRVTPAMGAPEPPPGSTVRNLLLSDTRVPLRLFTGVDVTALRSVTLLLDDSDGSVQLADMALHGG